MRAAYRTLALLVFALLIYDLGFDQNQERQQWILWGYFASMLAFSSFEFYSLFTTKGRSNLLSILRLALPCATFLIILYAWIIGQTGFSRAMLRYEGLFIMNVLLVLFFELAIYVRILYARAFSPMALFAGSFLFLIAAGAFFLMLPNAAVSRMTFTDAVFTAASAVCVTGLTVLDTGRDFTLLGQLVILGLIQLGGLGMLTLTTFFAYFFRGSTSFQEQILVKDFLSSTHLGGLLELALKIVLFTFAIELLGAAVIYYTLPEGAFPTFSRQLFFSVFHAVSAFCNAGFSTLSSGLFAGGFQFAYALQLCIAVLIILGGLGYANIFNLLRYIPLQMGNWYRRYILGNPKYAQAPRPVTLNTRIVLSSTTILLLGGTLLFYLLEYRHAFAAHQSTGGKLVTAFFSAVTPRTAGFNTIDLTELAMPSMILTLILMWIGASPASTGGGVKTSTFALALLNVVSTVRSKGRIELNAREVPQHSVNRAFAIIVLSLLVIGVASFLLTISETGREFLPIVFEVVSAYSTVGLSLGITAGCTDFGKWVLIVVMFVGRVGSVNLLIGMLRQVKNTAYRYPEEYVLIN